MPLIAHISDLHIGPLPTPAPLALASKRLTGYANWRFRRRWHHRRETLDLVIADLKAQNPDHVAVTGDLVNIALPQEFVIARSVLEAIGLPDRVSLVPGNHDAYVPGALDMAWRSWAPYMLGDGGSEPGYFPYMRRRGQVALVGISTAVPTPPGYATGRAGPAQCARLATQLAALGRDGLFRIVMIHHPPVDPGIARKKCLEDADQVCAAIAVGGAELVLHGHTHDGTVYEIGPARIPSVGVPSASALREARGEHAGYNLIDIEGRPGDWQVTLIRRDCSGEGGRIVEAWRHTLHRRRDRLRIVESPGIQG